MSDLHDLGAVSPLKAWLRKERGRSKALAEFAGCEKTHVSGIAAGRSKPSADLLRSIVEFAQGALTIDDVLWPWRDEFKTLHTASVADGSTGALPQSTADSEVTS